jgi:hypothetical protein
MAKKLVDIVKLTKKWGLKNVPDEYMSFFASDLPNKINGRVLGPREYHPFESLPFYFSNTLLDFIFNEAGFEPEESLLKKDGKLAYLPVCAIPSAYLYEDLEPGEPIADDKDQDFEEGFDDYGGQEFLVVDISKKNLPVIEFIISDGEIEINQLCGQLKDLESKFAGYFNEDGDE